MDDLNVVWLPTVKEKLLQFRSIHFTSEETLDFIYSFIMDIEELLKNYIVGQTYTEEVGPYQGLSRIVIRKFRVYYQKDHNNIVILAILFPGEK